MSDRPKRSRTEDIPGTRGGLHQIKAPVMLPDDERLIRRLIRKRAADKDEERELLAMFGLRED